MSKWKRRKQEKLKENITTLIDKILLIENLKKKSTLRPNVSEDTKYEQNSLNTTKYFRTTQKIMSKNREKINLKETSKIEELKIFMGLKEIIL